MPCLKTMRATLTAALLITTLLAACATEKDVLTAKDIPQSGTLKVHPGLVKSPPAAQRQPTPVTAPANPPPAATAEAGAEKPSETPDDAAPARQE